MKRLPFVLLAGLTFFVTVGVGWYLKLPLFPARQEPVTLLYTGDVQGYLVPCPT